MKIIIKKPFTDWLIQLANRGFGLSTDAFLKSLKKFLDKGVRTIRRSGSFPDHTSVICYVLFHDDRFPDRFIFLELIARLLCNCKRSL